jgi:hypothetical protein
MYILLIFIFNHFIYYLHVAFLLHQECNYENISELEDGLQTRFHHLPLGKGRLWRHVAKGGYTKEQKDNKQNVFKVFLTMIPLKKIDEHLIIYH